MISLLITVFMKQISGGRVKFKACHELKTKKKILFPDRIKSQDLTGSSQALTGQALVTYYSEQLQGDLKLYSRN